MCPDKEQVRIKYDKNNDILYITFGQPRPSYCVAEIDDVFIMKDIETDEYSGFKILDFSTRLNDGSLYTLDLPFSFDLTELGKQFPFTQSH
jgi:uncharacterized protein YuzE